MDIFELSDTVFAGCKVGSLLSRSDASASYLALKDDREALLVVFQPELASGSRVAAEELFEGAGRAAGLHHQNLAGVLEAGEEAGIRYVLRENAEGESLQALLAKSGRLSPEKALSLLRQVLAGLSAAHAAGIRHGDLSPASVTVSPGGLVKLTDLGLPGKLLREAGFGPSEAGAENLTYISSEQAAKAAEDLRSDLYSLGVVAFEMLVGKPPFQHKSPLGLKLMHQTMKPPSVLKLTPETPEELASFIARLLEKKPENRFADATEAFAALTGERPPASPGVTPGTSEPAKPGKIRLVEPPENAPSLAAAFADDAGLPKEAPPVEGLAGAPEPGAFDLLPGAAASEETPESGDLQGSPGEAGESKPAGAAAGAADPGRRSILASALFGPEPGEEPEETVTSTPAGGPDEGVKTSLDEPMAAGVPEKAVLSRRESGLVREMVGDLFQEASKLEAPAEAAPAPPERGEAEPAPPAEAQPEPAEPISAPEVAPAPPAGEPGPEYVQLTDQGRRQLEEYDYDGAVATLRRAVALDSTAQDARDLLASAEDLRANLQAKEAELEKVLEGGDTLETERVAREMLLLHPRHERAQQALEGIEQLDRRKGSRKEADKLVLKSHRALQDKDYETASSLIDAAEKLDPDRQDLPHLRKTLQDRIARMAELRRAGDSAYEAGDSPAALAAYTELRDLVRETGELDERLRELKPEEPGREHLVAAQEFFDGKDYDAAGEEIEKALAEDPGNPIAAALKQEIADLRAHVEEERRRAREHFSQKQYKLAQQNYMQVLFHFPRDAEARGGLEEIKAVFARHGKGPSKVPLLIGAAAVLLVLVGGAVALWLVNSAKLDRAEKYLEAGKHKEAKAALDGILGPLVDSGRAGELRKKIEEKAKASAATADGAQAQTKGGTEDGGGKGPGDGQGGPGTELPKEARIAKLIAQAKEKLEKDDPDASLEALSVAKDLGAKGSDFSALFKKASGAKIVAGGKRLALAGQWEDAAEEFMKARDFDKAAASAALDGLFADKMTEVEGQRRSAVVEWAEKVARFSERCGKVAEGAARIEKEATLALDSRRFDEAALTFGVLDRLSPEGGFGKRGMAARYEQLLEQGTELLDAGRREEGIKSLESAARIGTDSRAAVLLQKARKSDFLKEAAAHEKAGRLAEALETWKRIAGIDKEDQHASKKVSELQARLDYDAACLRMETAFKAREVETALEAGRKALATGIDGGYAARAVRWLEPLASMVHVPAGKVLMGDPEGRDFEKPQYEAELPEFFIGANEVSVAEYARFLEGPGKGSAAEPEGWEALKSNPGLPVTGVSLAEAKAYAQSLDLDIPTEEEWERAASGGDGRRWPLGPEFKPEAANTWESGRRAPAPVKDFPGDLSPLGCHNMTGNVAEWTSSPFELYAGGTGELPGGRFVVRGGDFSFNSKYARCAGRRGAPPESRKDFIGFRCIRRIAIETLKDLK